MKFLMVLGALSHMCFAADPMKQDFEKKIQQLTKDLGPLMQPDSLTIDSLKKVFVSTDQIHELIGKNPYQFIQWYGKNSIKSLYQVIDELSAFGYVANLIAANKFQEIQNISWQYDQAEKIIYGSEHGAQEQVEKIRSATYRYELQYLEVLKEHKALSVINREILFLSLALPKTAIDSLPTTPPVFAQLKYTLKQIKKAFTEHITKLGLKPPLRKNTDDLIQLFSHDVIIIYLLI